MDRLRANEIGASKPKIERQYQVDQRASEDPPLLRSTTNVSRQATAQRPRLDAFEFVFKTVATVALSEDRKRSSARETPSLALRQTVQHERQNSTAAEVLQFVWCVDA